jgi:hypothetical protein
LIAAAEKQTGLHYRSLNRLGKESLRNGESEYGRQLSGIAQAGAVYANSTLAGQLFLGSEIALLEPLSFGSTAVYDKTADDTLSRKQDTEEKTAQEFSELKDAEKVRPLPSQQAEAKSEHSFANAKNDIQNGESSPTHQIEQGFLSQLSFADVPQFPLDVWKKNDDVIHDQPLLIPATINTSSQVSKPPLSGLPFGIDSQKFQSSELVAAPSAKFFLLGHPRSNNVAIIKNVDKDLGDTLMSDSFSRLDARGFSQVEFIVYNGRSNATLIGNASDNTLIGSVGNDSLIGASGNDQLVGGAGNDLFIVNANDGHDQIIDFSFGDKIQFRGAGSLDDLEFSTSNTGHLIQFGATTIEIVGVRDLTINTDWIILSN